MKCRKLLTGLLALSAAAVMGVSVPTTANAARESAVKENKALPTIVNRPSLSRQGYVLRIINDKDADPIYVGKKSYEQNLKHIGVQKNAKTISAKKVQKIKFKIVKVAKMNAIAFAAPEYLVVSKDKKYSCWTTQAQLQYFYMNDKDMSGVKKPLTRIANRSNTSLKTKKNLHDFNLAVKAAKKLHGSKKTFVLRNLKLLKKTGSMSIEGKNLLTFGL